jgi:hypothetical protein
MSIESGDLPVLKRRTVFPEPAETMADVDANLRAMVEAARPAEEVTAEQSGAPAEASAAEIAASGTAAAVSEAAAKD